MFSPITLLDKEFFILDQFKLGKTRLKMNDFTLALITVIGWVSLCLGSSWTSVWYGNVAVINFKKIRQILLSAVRNFRQLCLKLKLRIYLDIFRGIDRVSTCSLICWKFLSCQHTLICPNNSLLVILLFGGNAIARW